MTLERRAATAPVGRVRQNAFGQPQADEEFLFAWVRTNGFGANRFPSLRPIHILERRFHILPASDAVERMRVGTKTTVPLAPPVFQVVERLRAGLGEIGNLIAMEAAPVEILHSRFVKRGDLIV